MKGSPCTFQPLLPPYWILKFVPMGKQNRNEGYPPYFLTIIVPFNDFGSYFKVDTD